MDKDMKRNDTAQKKLECNCCGKRITKEEQTIVQADYLHIDKYWGYFSKRDLKRHTFNICEECYDKWIQSFKIPVEESIPLDVMDYSNEQLEQLQKAYKEENN